VLETDHHKHLGLTLQNGGEWQLHIRTIIEKTSKMTNFLRSLKYRLSRKSLEKIYCSFILPVFDYADIIWDNCTLYLSEQLENIQLDALRTICGAVRGTSHKSLYNETGFIPLIERRKRHKLCMMYRLCNGLSPRYLSIQLPRTVSQTNRYSLRNAEQFQSYKCRTKLYSESFFPSTVNLWNNLPIYTKKSTSISSFKNRLKVRDSIVPAYFYDGERKQQILHCRLRLGISDLNGHKFKRFIEENPHCACGHHIEDSEHFLLFCPLYKRERQTYLAIPNQLNINNLLFGDPNLTLQENSQLFEAVQHFIAESKRFD
jgi:hypothetical protein